LRSKPSQLSRRNLLERSEEGTGEVNEAISVGSKNRAALEERDRALDKGGLVGEDDGRWIREYEVKCRGFRAGREDDALVEGAEGGEGVECAEVKEGEARGS